MRPIRLPQPLRRLIVNRRAATAVEYALIAALIVLAMVAALDGVAKVTIGMWNNIAANQTKNG